MIADDSPLARWIEPFERFMHVEAAAGGVLLACTVVALVLANSPFSASYLHLWETDVGFHIGSLRVSHSLHHWINDGLMALFFFVVGLEVKRELVLGELRDPRRAALPVVAAIGGMLVPAAIFLALRAGTPSQRGWGIPMATDIAFVVGCMAVLGSRIPHGLRIMVLTLAIADDIGAILVIAFAYSTGIRLVPLLVEAGGLGLIVLLARLGVRSFGIYTLIGLVVWFAFQESGVHATIAGVLLGLLTPARPHLSRSAFAGFVERATEVMLGEGWAHARNRSASVRAFRRITRETVSPLEYLESMLHPWVGFAIMPIFALANAGVPLQIASFGDPIAVAVGAGTRDRKAHRNRALQLDRRARRTRTPARRRRLACADRRRGAGRHRLHHGALRRRPRARGAGAGGREGGHSLRLGGGGRHRHGGARARASGAL
jgi:Na+:H+ antiporter, NhaA family